MNEAAKVAVQAPGSAQGESQRDRNRYHVVPAKHRARTAGAALAAILIALVLDFRARQSALGLGRICRMVSVGTGALRDSGEHCC